jgi:uncharacterized protein (TIGR00725 family)
MTPEEQKHYLKYKICVSGAAETSHCPENATKMAEKLGQEIVWQNGVVVTGATTGMPYWAAKGAKMAGGVSIGLSPAASEIAHIKSYRLPVDYFDLIIYTGFNYAGRNLLLTRASDAVVVTCGRMGTLNEFTIAFEDNKPIGILDLEGDDGTTDMIRDIVKTAKRGPGKIVYDSDPKKLIQKLIPLIDKEKGVKMPKV